MRQAKRPRTSPATPPQARRRDKAQTGNLRGHASILRSTGRRQKWGYARGICRARISENRTREAPWTASASGNGKIENRRPPVFRPSRPRGTGEVHAPKLGVSQASRQAAGCPATAGREPVRPGKTVGSISREEPRSRSDRPHSHPRTSPMPFHPHPTGQPRTPGRPRRPKRSPRRALQPTDAASCSGHRHRRRLPCGYRRRRAPPGQSDARPAWRTPRIRRKGRQRRRPTVRARQKPPCRRLPRRAPTRPAPATHAVCRPCQSEPGPA